MNQPLAKLRITAALESLKGDLASASYILMRIKTHRSLYHAYIQTHDGDETAAVRLLYVLMLGALRAGHTILWLDDALDTKPSDEQQATLSRLGLMPVVSVLGVWQALLVGRALVALLAVLGVDEGQPQTIEDIADERDVIARVFLLFGQTVVAVLEADKAQAGQILATYLNELRVNLVMFGLNGAHALVCDEFLRLLMRFCYVCYHKPIKQLDEFYGYLSDSAFVMLTPTVLDDNKISELARPLVISQFFCSMAHSLDACEVDKPRGFALWLHRAWLSESLLYLHSKRLLSVTSAAFTIPNLDARLNPEQKNAILAMLSYNFVIITGGPGTGKTFTIAQFVMALDGLGQTPTLALVAPTGKAAQRMQESLMKAMGDGVARYDALTIHRLLGMGVDGVARYNERTPLPYDVIVVDEASMLGAELCHKLFCAIKTGAKVILLGDVHQLAAVEAGAVLADLCAMPNLKPYHHRLIESRRFDDASGVGRLAGMIYKASGAWQQHFEQIIKQDNRLSLTNLAHKPKEDIYQALIEPYQAYIQECRALFFLQATQERVRALFGVLGRYRILCASHRGAFGDEALNEIVGLWHINQTAKHPFLRLPTWYHGRVVMMTKNNYTLGLFNGDMGICLRQKIQSPKQEKEGAERFGFVVYFDGKDAPIAVSLLNDEEVVSAYAITIHKSQGSEFDKVAICLDDSNQKLLTRELIYTAITRAKESIDLYSTDSALARAINTPSLRHTGLCLLSIN